MKDTTPTQGTADQLQTNAATTSPPVPDAPYSIFDKRQKWLIIAIVSTAATCKFENHSVTKKYAD